MDVKLEYMKPGEIEARSFEIIRQELEDRGVRLDPTEDAVIRRVIHTTADFDYVNNLVFSPGAVGVMKEAIVHGAWIITDTNMTRSGINCRLLSSFGGECRCFMSEDDVAAEAKKRGVTRATVSMERAAALDRDVIFAVGNAPTALIRLFEMIRDGQIAPLGIIGVPVGFVNVVEAKELILDSGIPYIVARGRKGGSNVAAAIVNAMLYELDPSRGEQKNNIDYCK